MPVEPLPADEAEPVAYMVSRIKANKPIEGLTAIDINVKVIHIIDWAKESVKTGAESEKQSLMATAGKANVTDVVTAVSAAEVTLQAVTAVRDKAVAAYQEILRMPI